jgi:hypothetical protein
MWKEDIVMMRRSRKKGDWVLTLSCIKITHKHTIVKKAANVKSKVNHKISSTQTQQNTQLTNTPENNQQ